MRHVHPQHDAPTRTHVPPHNNAHTQAAARGQKAAVMTAPEEGDPLADKYGDSPLVQSAAVTGRVWTRVDALDASFKDKEVGRRWLLACMTGCREGVGSGG